MYVEKLPWEVNYDESAIPPYTLPDVLLCQDGSKVDSAEKWLSQRRPELLQLFKNVMYGELPPMPQKISYEVLSEKNDARNNRAIRREVRMTFENNGKSQSVIMLYYLPKNVQGKVPLFVGLTFHGNHVVSTEPDIQITGTTGDELPDYPISREHGFQERRFPIDTLLDRGYALCVASYNDIYPDLQDAWDQSIYKLFYDGDELKRPKNSSSISAWAWCISRMTDYMVTLPEIDSEKIAVFGHSRLGKTALWAGANDERFKVVCVNDSGCGGAALSRRLFGETLYAMMVYCLVGKYWYTDSLYDKAITPELLPIDQHELIALIAPRAAVIHSADADLWADPKSEYLAAYHAGKVYELFGKKPLESIEPPPVEEARGEYISYYCRKGEHDILASDWQHYLSIADMVFNK